MLINAKNIYYLYSDRVNEKYSNILNEISAIIKTAANNGWPFTEIFISDNLKETLMNITPFIKNNGYELSIEYNNVVYYLNPKNNFFSKDVKFLNSDSSFIEGLKEYKKVKGLIINISWANIVNLNNEE